MNRAMSVTDMLRMKKETIHLKENGQMPSEHQSEVVFGSSGGEAEAVRPALR